MPYTADEQIDLTEEIGNKYIISSQHRRTGNPKKSIWIISFDEEVACFKQTINEKWIDGAEAWGVKESSGTIQTIGASADGEEFKIAKFVDGNKNCIWHGYPADCMNKAQDRPATAILKDWVRRGYITKAKMNKIRQGQSCSL